MVSPSASSLCASTPTKSPLPTSQTPKTPELQIRVTLCLQLVYNKVVRETLKKHWGKIFLILILAVILVFNFKPGYFILGNDNYSPELNPTLSVKRFLENPAWRSYRALGVASDSDQADFPRAILYFALSKALPLWMISQLFVFACLFTGVISTAFLTVHLLKDILKKKETETVLFVSGLVYLTGLLTIWIFFSPLNAFVAVYAFLPLLLYRLSLFINDSCPKNALYLFLSSLAISTAGLVPTIFIIVIAIILFFSLYKIIKTKTNLKNTLLAFLIFIIPHLSWILPFTIYVKTNTEALQESFINRMLTPDFVESEIKYNTPTNTLRFYSSWIEVKNNDGSDVYPYRDWYQNSPSALFLGLLPIFLTIFSLSFVKKKSTLLFFPLLFLLGFFLIKGINPPGGFVYESLQQNIPLFKQVFRWQSSKLWPLMSITLPLLSSLGLLFFLRLKTKPIVKPGLIALLSLFLLYHLYPFFRGHMIQERNYVSIPPEYYHLSLYLQKNNPNARIYLAPEANTLYFRHHDWGFWGSSFLNYLLPNPLIEKALTTGSQESENAQKIIESAYYSEDHQILNSVLRRFNTPYILADRSASDRGNGYLYDRSVFRNSLERNPDLNIVWQEGNLALYQLDISSNPRLIPLSSEHNFKSLNQIFTRLNDNNSYYTNPDLPGDIYPLALDFNKQKISNQDLILSTIYQGPTAQYVMNHDLEYQDQPLAFSYQKEEEKISFYPSQPLVYLNNSLIAELSPASFFYQSKKERYRFLTTNDYVFDLEKTDSYTSEKLYKNLDNLELSLWLPESKKITLIDNYLVPENDSVIEIFVNHNLTQETAINLCIWQEDHYRCLSPNISAHLKPGTGESKILVPVPIKANEKITFFIESQDSSDLQNRDITLSARLYQKKEPIIIQEETLGVTAPTPFTLRKGDLITLNLPKIYGPNSFHLNPEGDFLPEYSHQDCSWENRSYPSQSSLSLEKQVINFSSVNCFGGIYSKLYRLFPADRLGLISYRAQNNSGIPLDVSIKVDKHQRPSYKERIYPETTTDHSDYFLLPAEQKTYFLDVFSRGIGPRESLNRLEDLSLMFIPNSWFNMKLELKNPRVLSKNDLVTINEAVSPSWKNKTNTPITINGWQQAWIKNKDSKPLFWPDHLTYFGYAATLFLFIYLLAKVTKPKKG